MSIITWLILGLVAGFVASRIVDHRGQGLVLDIVFGVLGAMLGGFLVHLAGGSDVTGFNAWSLLVAIGGAAVLLVLRNAVIGRRRPALFRGFLR